MQQSNLFYIGFFKLDAESLAYQLAIWRKLHILSLVKNKSVHWKDSQRQLNKDIDKLKNEILESIKQPHHVQDLRIQIFCEICILLGIKYENITTKTELKETCSLIEEKAIEKQKELSGNGFDGNTTEDLIRFTFSSLFNDLSAAFSKGSEQEKEEIAYKVKSVIDDMPDDYKSVLQEKLKVSDLSKNTIAKIIAAGTGGIGFSSLIQVGGFGAYTFATQTLSVMAGTVGVTLPFSAYIALTSFIAFLSNPVTLAAMLSGGGLWINNAGTKQVRMSYLPICITQICISGVESNNDLESHIYFLKNVSSYETRAEAFRRNIDEQTKMTVYELEGAVERIRAVANKDGKLTDYTDKCESIIEDIADKSKETREELKRSSKRAGSWIINKFKKQ